MMALATVVYLVYNDVQNFYTITLSLSALPVHHERAGDAEQHQRRPGLHGSSDSAYGKAHNRGTGGSIHCCGARPGNTERRTSFPTQTPLRGTPPPRSATMAHAIYVDSGA